MLRSLRSLSLVLAVAGLMAPAAAHAAPAPKASAAAKSRKASRTSKVTYPSIKTVQPLRLGIGDKLTIRGRGYRSGGRNYVVFKRDGGRALFVKADKATSSKLTVTV